MSGKKIVKSLKKFNKQIEKKGIKKALDCCRVTSFSLDEKGNLIRTVKP